MFLVFHVHISIHHYITGIIYQAGHSEEVEDGGRRERREGPQKKMKKEVIKFKGSELGERGREGI